MMATTSQVRMLFMIQDGMIIKGSDNDQDIYLTHGSDIIDGAGEVILFISMNCQQIVI